METKEVRIEIPECYEIDKEKSSFEKIVFKKKEHIVNCWEDIKWINGIYINAYSEFDGCVDGSNNPRHSNVFLNEKYAKSALAIAQISQLLPYYDTKIDWTTDKWKWCIVKKDNKIKIDIWQHTYFLLSFNTREEAQRFLKHNEQLVKDYYMI